MKRPVSSLAFVLMLGTTLPILSGCSDRSRGADRDDDNTELRFSDLDRPPYRDEVPTNIQLSSTSAGPPGALEPVPSGLGEGQPPQEDEVGDEELADDDDSAEDEEPAADDDAQADDDDMESGDDDDSTPLPDDDDSADDDDGADDDDSSADDDDSAATEPVFDPWTLWTGGPQLRGANFYQQDEGRDDGASNTGFGPLAQQSDFDALRAAGANLVVLSVPGTWRVQQVQPWPEMQAHLGWLIDAAEAADLFVVIAFRTGPGRGEGDITNDGLPDHSVYYDATQRAGWVDMWVETALEYADRPHVLGYDLMVEPHDHTPDSWASLAQELVDGIRTVDTETPILVSPGDWGGAEALGNFFPLADPSERLVYTVHQYEPYYFTHGTQTLSSAQLDDELADLYGIVEGWASTHDVPVTVNEMGLVVDNMKSNSLHFLEEQNAYLEQLSSGHAVWHWEVATDGYYAADIQSDAGVLALWQDNWDQNSAWPSTEGL